MQPHNYILAGMYIASIMAPTGYNCMVEIYRNAESRLQSIPEILDQL